MIAQISTIDNYYSVNPDPAKKKDIHYQATSTKAGIVKLAIEIEANDSSNNTVSSILLLFPVYSIPT